MAYKSLGRHGLLWPCIPGGFFNSTAVALDTANDASAYIGQVCWADGGSHTIDNSGGTNGIYLHTGPTATFGDASAVMHIGIQDVDVSTGFPGRPDGTYDVNSVVTTSANTSPALGTASTLVRATPTAGSKTMAHGDLIAVVATLNTVGSSPASNVGISRHLGAPLSGLSPALPFGASNISGSWASGSGAPIVLLRAADGTWGTLEGIICIGQYGSVSFNDSSGTDEHGVIFQVPYDCKAKGCVFTGNALAGATSDFQYDLTSSPLSSPASLLGGPVSVPAESLGGSSQIVFERLFPSLISLSQGVDYCMSFKATGAGNINIYRQTLPDAGARVLLQGGVTTFGATRNNGSGAFTSSDTIIPSIAVRLAEADFPTGGGGGSSQVIGN